MKRRELQIWVIILCYEQPHVLCIYSFDPLLLWNIDYSQFKVTFLGGDLQPGFFFVSPTVTTDHGGFIIIYSAVHRGKLKSVHIVGNAQLSAQALAP